MGVRKSNMNKPKPQLFTSPDACQVATNAKEGRKKTAHSCDKNSLKDNLPVVGLSMTFWLLVGCAPPLAPEGG